MNAHIHLLEALTALAEVWQDELLTRRLREVFCLVRDKFTRPAGHLAMFCRRDFAPTDRAGSYGHQLEMVYLLHECEQVLRRRGVALDIAEVKETRRAMRSLAEHALRYGSDEERGGFYYEGPPAAAANHRQKSWWVQPEAMNGLLTMWLLAATDERRRRYAVAFARTWRFFRDHVVDHRHGGCFDTVAPDGSPLPGKRHKAHRWKTAYHVTRGLIHAVEKLA